MAGFIKIPFNIHNIDFYMHDKCAMELKKIEKNPSIKKKIRKKFLFYLNIISEQGIEGITKNPNMEVLSGANGFCSMHINTNIALRILFKYEMSKSGRNHVIVTLVSFQEDGDKVHSNSYDKHLSICEDRYKDWKENKK